MQYMVARGIRVRLFIVLALIGIGALAILARGFQLQIIDAPRLKSIADSQHKQTLELQAKRGDILDSRGEPLAVSSMKNSQVFARVEEVKDPEGSAREVGQILKMSSREERELARKLSQKETPFIWITRYASDEQSEAILDLKISGIGVVPSMRRFYPGTSLLANVIGFVGVEGKGLEGLEYKYDGVLAGGTIRILQERDGRGKPVFILGRSGPEGVPESGDASSYDQLANSGVRGGSLKLTIFRPLQHLVEQELEKGVKNAGAKGGCVVAMDPLTGKVLAMASWPTFDPNRFQNYEQDDYRNRCVVDAYEPGSTFKVFVTAYALETGAVGARDKFYCENGAYLLGGSTIRDTKPHGWLEPFEIIAYSSNIGAAKIGERLGKEGLYNAVRAFGFGEKTGINISGESPGVLRHYSQWSQVGVGNISFGQGIAVTPLQMVTALSALANKGMLMKPCLVESSIGADGVETMIGGEEKMGRVVSPETAALVTEYMKKVVEEGGTGSGAAVAGYRVAGKTGTAQKPMPDARGYAEGKYVSSFMGFLPASRPVLAMIVVLDEPSVEKPYGGIVAAPIFQAIARKAMVLLKVPAEEEISTISAVENNFLAEAASGSQGRIHEWETTRAWREPVTRAYEGDLVMPDLIGLTIRQALKALRGAPVRMEVGGTGRVSAQYPAPGGKIQTDVIRIQLEP